MRPRFPKPSALRIGGIGAVIALQSFAQSPQPYIVARDPGQGVLTLSLPQLIVKHDLRKGGAISLIALTHGKETNLLVEPVGTVLRDAKDTVYSDLRDAAPHVTHRTSGPLEIVVVESALKDLSNRPALVELRTTYEYHWGFVKVRREYRPKDPSPWREVRVLDTLVAPSLNHYGFRQGKTEREGGTPFDFGSCSWGTVTGRPGAVAESFLPHYIMLANPGVEGLEWFVLTLC